MKTFLLFSILSLSVICRTHAQQTSKTKHMIITIIDEHVSFNVGSKPNNMFITRDDTAQVQKWVDLNPHVKAKDKQGAYEAMLMKLIQPYFNQGWKLVSTSAEAVPPKPVDETFRYYFTKDR